MSIAKNFEGLLLGFLERAPLLMYYSHTRGWKFVLAWSHRIAGLLLAAYLLLHIYTLSLLSDPKQFTAIMETYSSLFFKLLEWLLAVPLIFHALNGGRLILYEGFEMRNDGSMIRYLLGFSFLYVALLGILMLMGTQSVSPVFYWLTMLIAALTLAYGVASKFWKTRHSLLWKLQRISGAFLLVMVSAHLLFMHLNPSVGKDANIVIMRMQNWFIKFIDLSLIVMVIYHACYGLISVIRDYISFRVFRTGLAVLVILVMVIFAWAGIRLTIAI